MSTPSTTPSTTPATFPTVISGVAVRRGPQPNRTTRNLQFAAEYNAGASNEDLAQKFGLTVSTVRQYVVRLRKAGLITRRPRQDRPRKAERNAEIVKRRADGESVADLAKNFGLSPMQVRNVLSDHKARTEARLDADPILYAAVRLSTINRLLDGDEAAQAAVRGALLDALSAYEAAS